MAAEGCTDIDVAATNRARAADVVQERLNRTRTLLLHYEKRNQDLATMTDDEIEQFLDHNASIEKELDQEKKNHHEHHGQRRNDTDSDLGDMNAENRGQREDGTSNDLEEKQWESSSWWVDNQWGYEKYLEGRWQTTTWEEPDKAAGSGETYARKAPTEEQEQASHLWRVETGDG